MNEQLPAVEKPKRDYSLLATISYLTYFGPVMLAMPYFQWRYASEAGFFAWLFFGEVVAAFQAMLWPLWVGLWLFGY